MKSRPNVALIIETSSVYGLQILSGIARFQKSQGGWSVLLDEGVVRGLRPDFLDNVRCDGIISRSTSPTWMAALAELEIPFVDLNDRHGYLGVPRVGSDMRAIGRMAAEHLLERGFRHVAFCGFENELWSEERCAGIELALEGRGGLCGYYRTPYTLQRQSIWSEEREKLCAWLESLPRPLGIVACNDMRGYSVLDACRALGIAVPEEIAVVGVDNAETFCELCDPPLSSVVPDASRIGFEAAQLLDQLMSGEEVENVNRLISPREVKTRQSSDVLAIADPVIAAALHYIREHACDGIGMTDVIRHASLSRSSLERGVRFYLGHSPQEEIRRVRLTRVKQLLRETDWSLTRIAEATGFEYANYMMVQFKRSFGMTPTEWRKTNQ